MKIDPEHTPTKQKSSGAKTIVVRVISYYLIKAINANVLVCDLIYKKQQ